VIRSGVAPEFTLYSGAILAGYGLLILFRVGEK
jgi:hypothetical protein